MNEVIHIKALVFNTFVGPEVLEYEEITEPVIDPDEILDEFV
jgi:NADPH:quinone reductase